MSILASNLTDRLQEANKRVIQENNKKTEIQQDAEEDEMGYAYAAPEHHEFLNENKGIFQNKQDENALNTAKSVFDKTAVFRVKENSTSED